MYTGSTLRVINLSFALCIDESLVKDGALVKVALPASRLLLAPTGPLNRDYDDVRRLHDAAAAGIKRSLYVIHFYLYFYTSSHSVQQVEISFRENCFIQYCSMVFVHMSLLCLYTTIQYSI